MRANDLGPSAGCEPGAGVGRGWRDDDLGPDDVGDGHKHAGVAARQLQLQALESQARTIGQGRRAARLGDRVAPVDFQSVQKILQPGVAALRQQ